jgi:hypothetical protein
MKENECEFIKDQYSNREQTNIIIATLTSSFSFTLLGIFISQVLFQEPFNFGMAYTLIIVGLIFTLVGLLYREVNTFLLGVFDLKYIKTHSKPSENIQEIISPTIRNRVILRILFYFPLGLWVGILLTLGYSLPSTYITLIIILTIGTPTAVLTWTERVTYRQINLTSHANSS